MNYLLRLRIGTVSLAIYCSKFVSIKKCLCKYSYLSIKGVSLRNLNVFFPSRNTVNRKGNSNCFRKLLNYLIIRAIGKYFEEYVYNSKNVIIFLLDKRINKNRYEEISVDLRADAASYMLANTHILLIKS